MEPSESHPSTNKLGKLLRTNRWAQLAEILLVFLVAFVFIQVFEQEKSDNLIVNQAIIWIANILMLLMVWAGAWLRGESWADFGLGISKITSREALKGLFLSIVVFVLAMLGFVLGSIIMANITGIPENADMSGYAYLKDNIGMLLLTLVGVYIVSSFGEEVVYRSFLINRISQLGMDSKMARITALLLSSLIFGFAHYSWGPMGIVQTTFMGLALGSCFLWLKKRLWILIIAHAYMDTILMVQMYFNSN